MKKMIANWKTYMKCQKCQIFEYTEDMSEAKAKAELHEAECHKKKPVANFGKELSCFELGMD